MQAALKGLPTTKFTAPDDKTMRGDVKDLPYVNGMPRGRRQQAAVDWLRARDRHRQVDRSRRPAPSPTSAPRTEDGAPEGSKVTIYISNGSKASPPPVTGTPLPPNPPTTGKPGGGNQCPPWHPKYPNCGRGGR